MLQASRSTLAISLAMSIFFLLGVPSPAPSQTTAIAEVFGTVTDPTGSAVVGAQVTITETDKHTVFSAVTNQIGHFLFPSLPVGPYRLEVRASGFKDYVQSGLELQVGNNVQINVALQVGSLSETVEVKAAVNLVETKENSISAVIDGRRINELPMNGRQATSLIFMVGAAAYGGNGDTGSKTFYSSTTISVAGGQGNGTAYLLDGGDNTDAMSNVNMPFPFPDALQEFSVETSAVSSRFGTHPGATVNVVTKSGANQLHGDLFDYFRNGDLNARNFFAPKHDSLKRNQFGGTAGGKIITDKLFFFGGYQGTRQRTNPPQTISFVPTPASLNGDFSALAGAGCQSSGRPLQLVDPLNNNAPFTNNQIPVSRINPAALKIASSYLPVSSDPCGKVVYGIPTLGDEDQIIGRIDFVQNSKNTMYGRYFMDQYSNPAVFDGHNVLTTTQPGNLERAQSATAGDTYTFGPGTLNSFHFTFNRRRDDRGPTAIPISPTLFGVNMYNAVPNFLLLTITNAFSTFCGTCAPGHFNVNSFQAADDVDIIRGKHEMAFGFNLIRVQNNTVSGFDENGSFTFNGSRTNLAVADFMTGLVQDFIQTNATPDDLRQWIMSVYAQDTYHVSPKLTLNFGLRWEPTFSDPDKYGRGTSFSLPAFLGGQFSKVYPNAPAGLFFKGDAGIPDAMWNGHKANFAPRAGLVWNPSGKGKDTLRVGGALLYENNETWFNERETTNAPIGTSTEIINPVGGFSNPWQGYPGGNPFPTNGRALFPASGGIYINFPINPKSTYVAQWNATYQRQIKDWLVSASYLGNKTTHLWMAGEVNPAIYNPAPGASTTSNTQARRRLTALNPTYGPSYASINTMDDGAVAHYQAVLLSVKHSFGHGFTLLTNYTDSYCVSDQDFGAALATSSNSFPFSRGIDRGPCNFDTRHNFNTSLVATSMVKGSPWARRLLSDWQFAPLFHASSGQPLTITTGVDKSLTGLGNDRPVQVLSSYTPASNGCSGAPCYQFLNPAAFTPNATGATGNVGRGALRGPGNVSFDVAVSRRFRIAERFTLEARGEAFNIINHVNFVGAIQGAGTGSAGATTMNTNLSSSAFGKALAAFDPRIMQLVLKVYF
jgi:Carboxypeptidase regulatory-like domain